MKPNIPEAVLALIAKQGETFPVQYRVSSAWVVESDGELRESADWHVEARCRYGSVGGFSRDLSWLFASRTRALVTCASDHEARDVAESLRTLADAIELAWSHS